jgi:hypothetical protein
VGKADQTIAFGPLPGKILGAAPFTVSATASSTLPVAFSSVSPTVCTVTGNLVTLVAVGPCVIAANQAGNGNFNAALTVIQSLTVAPDCSVVSIAQTQLPVGVAGLLYSRALTLTNGASPVTWTISGTLPSGLSLTNGVLSGTPTNRGAFPITVTGTDANACQASASLTLSISADRRLLTGAGAGGAPTVRTFALGGSTPLTSFNAYAANFAGGVSVAAGDTNDDGVVDVITGAGQGGGPHVEVFDGVTGAARLSFFAFDPSFHAGVDVAAGDVNGDGAADIVAVGGCFAPNVVRVFDGSTGALLREYPFTPPDWSCGFHVAAGDVNGDGRADLIVSSAGLGVPFVIVLDGATGATIRTFDAFDSTFQGGVFVAAGDVNGDGFADIVTGAGPGGGPAVRIFDGVSGAEVRSFLAYDPVFAGGVRVAAGDLDGDGKAEIITGAGAAATHVKAFDSRSRAEKASLIAFPGAPYGVRVGAVDVNGDGKDDLLAAPGGPVPQVSVFDGATLQTIDSFFALAATSGVGVFLGGSR